MREQMEAGTAQEDESPHLNRRRIIRVMLGKKMNAAQRQKLQRSKLKLSKNQWKTKAMNRLDQLRLEKRKNRYLSKSRDRWKDRYCAEKTASQVSAACPEEPLLYLMVVDTSQTQAV